MGEYDEDQGFHNEDDNGERRSFNKRGGNSGGRSFNNNRTGGGRGSFNNRGPRRDFGPKEMHKATCAECGKECEVPFKPAEGRPVYCKECYRNKKEF